MDTTGPLTLWLTEQGAKMIRYERLRGGDQLAWYVAHGGSVILLHEYANDNGWEVYVQPTRSNSIAETIVALDAHLTVNRLIPIV